MGSPGLIMNNPGSRPPAPTDDVESGNVEGKRKEEEGSQHSKEKEKYTLKDLHQSVRKGEVSTVEAILKVVKVNQLDHKKLSALHIAAKYSYKDIIEILLKQQDINVDIEGPEKMTPLHYAARYGKNETEKNKKREDIAREKSDSVETLGISVIKLLLDKTKDIMKKDEYHLTPLHHAAMRGNYEVVEKLVIKMKNAVDIEDNQQSTPLHLAATYGNVKSAEFLLKNEAKYDKVDYQGQNALHRAAKAGNLDMIKLIQKYAGSQQQFQKLMKTPDVKGNTPMLLAVQAGQKKTVKALLEMSESYDALEDKNKRKVTSLHLAARRGDLG